MSRLGVSRDICLGAISVSPFIDIHHHGRHNEERADRCFDGNGNIHPVCPLGSLLLGSLAGEPKGSIPLIRELNGLLGFPVDEDDRRQKPQVDGVSQEPVGLEPGGDGLYMGKDRQAEKVHH